MKALAKVMDPPRGPRLNISPAPVLFEDGFRYARSIRSYTLSIDGIIANRQALFGKDRRVSDFWSGTLVGYAPGFSAFGEDFSYVHPVTGKRWSVAIPKEYRGIPFLSFCIHPGEYDFHDSAGAVEVDARDMRFEELAAAFPNKKNGVAKTGRDPVSSIVANFSGDIRRIFEIIKVSPPWAHHIWMRNGVEISQFNSMNGYFGPVSYSQDPGYESGLMLMDHTVSFGEFQKKYFVMDPGGLRQ